MAADERETNRQDDRERTMFLAELAAASTSPGAFEPLYHRFAQEMFAFSIQRTGDRDAAADMTSRIFLKAMRGMHGFRPSQTDPIGGFRGWLYQIARNEAIDRIRRMRPVDSLDSADEVEDGAPLPEEHHLRREAAGELRQMMTRLPIRQRQILELRLLDLTGEEIGRELGMTVSAVKSAQFRAYESLRRWYDERERIGHDA